MSLWIRLEMFLFPHPDLTYQHAGWPAGSRCCILFPSTWCFTTVLFLNLFPELAEKSGILGKVYCKRSDKLRRKTTTRLKQHKLRKHMNPTKKKVGGRLRCYRKVSIYWSLHANYHFVHQGTSMEQRSQKLVPTRPQYMTLF